MADIYNNKIIHATGKFRIDSINDNPNEESDITASPAVASGKDVTIENVAQKERLKEMRMWFDESMRARMGLPNGYSNVGVLLVKWADELDDLRTKEEVHNLEAVFRDRFYYQTQTVELNLSSKPQHQLHSYLTRFVQTHDGPNNLIIVYYTGHGAFKETSKNLELMARQPRPGHAPERGLVAQCNWNRAEAILRSEDVESDVLTIMDTCFASNLVVMSAKEESKVVEMLSASAIDQITASGDNSFTRVLIDALKELLDTNKGKPISTHSLNQHILRDERRRDEPSQLWYRSPNHMRHILLAPLKLPENSQSDTLTLPQSPLSYLTLRFALRHETLDWEQIQYLTRCLAASFHKTATVASSGIEWVSIKKTTSTSFEIIALAAYVIKKWRNIVKKKRERIARRGIDEVRFPIEPVIEKSPGPSTKRERASYLFGNYLEQDRKRENLMIPIFPPRSDCSRAGASSSGEME